MLESDRLQFTDHTETHGRRQVETRSGLQMETREILRQKVTIHISAAGVSTTEVRMQLYSSNGSIAFNSFLTEHHCGEQCSLNIAHRTYWMQSSHCTVSRHGRFAFWRATHRCIGNNLTQFRASSEHHRRPFAEATSPHAPCSLNEESLREKHRRRLYEMDRAQHPTESEHDLVPWLPVSRVLVPTPRECVIVEGQDKKLKSKKITLEDAYVCDELNFRFFLVLIEPDDHV